MTCAATSWCQWATFWQDFRATPRYGADVAALLNEASRRYGIAGWTFVGTSEFTAYGQAQRRAAKTRGALVSVRGGGPGKGGACQAFTAHGFVGVERAVVQPMRSWVRTGTVPGDVSAP